MGKYINIKSAVFLALLVGFGYLFKKFPDESVLLLGISAVLVIGMWLYQAFGED